MAFGVTRDVVHHARVLEAIGPSEGNGTKYPLLRYSIFSKVNIRPRRRWGIELPLPTLLSDTMHSSISFRKSTPPQNRQLNLLISNSKQ